MVVPHHGTFLHIRHTVPRRRKKKFSDRKSYPIQQEHTVVVAENFGAQKKREIQSVASCLTGHTDKIMQTSPIPMA